MDVEARLAEEAAALEAERIRLKEMEEIRAMLEQLLEEEKRAKRDEETVRNLQARLVMCSRPSYQVSDLGHGSVVAPVPLSKQTYD